MLGKIEEIISREIRPYLLAHYGDIEVLSYSNHNVCIRLLGQCKNCPSSNVTMKDVVESKLKEYIPEIKKVILYNDISEELYDFAKQILSRNKQE